MRHFGQTKDYWLDNCTLQEWRYIWQRELIESPPAEALLADYFEYDGSTGQSDDSEDSGEVEFDVSDCEA